MERIKRTMTARLSDMYRTINGHHCTSNGQVLGKTKMQRTTDKKVIRFENVFVTVTFISPQKMYFITLVPWTTVSYPLFICFHAFPVSNRPHNMRSVSGIPRVDRLHVRW